MSISSRTLTLNKVTLRDKKNKKGDDSNTDTAVQGEELGLTPQTAGSWILNSSAERHKQAGKQTYTAAPQKVVHGGIIDLQEWERRQGTEAEKNQKFSRSSQTPRASPYFPHSPPLCIKAKTPGLLSRGENWELENTLIIRGQKEIQQTTIWDFPILFSTLVPRR